MPVPLHALDKESYGLVLFSPQLTRDQTIQTLREEIEKSNRVRDANSDRFQARCVEEIESVKVGLRMETEVWAPARWIEDVTALGCAGMCTYIYVCVFHVL